MPKLITSNYNAPSRVLSLSDAQLQQLHGAAALLAVDQRDAFLRSVAGHIAADITGN